LRRSRRTRGGDGVSLAMCHVASVPCIVAGRHMKGSDMLETIAVILIVLWLLGMVTSYTVGSFIHVLLVIAIVLFLVRLVSGRRAV
jgi:hypothetical protein